MYLVVSNKRWIEWSDFYYFFFNLLREINKTLRLLTSLSWELLSITLHIEINTWSRSFVNPQLKVDIGIKRTGLWVSGSSGRDYEYRNQADGIMSIGIKGTGLWVSESSGRDYEYRDQADGIMSIGTKRTGLWVSQHKKFPALIYEFHFLTSHFYILSIFKIWFQLEDGGNWTIHNFLKFVLVWCKLR